MADLQVVQEWYATFVNVEQEVLFELILAANYMDIKPLLDLTCATVASMIKGKTPEEIRKTFNIVNDFRYVKQIVDTFLFCSFLTLLFYFFTVLRKKPKCERRTNGARKPSDFPLLPLLISP